MKKNDTIAGLNNAVKHQVFLMTRFHNVAFKEKYKEVLDFLHEEEDFGQFLNSKEANLEELAGFTFFDKMTKFYNQWRGECKRFFDLFIEDTSVPKPKLIKPNSRSFDLAKSIYADMEASNKELLAACKLTEARLYALAEDRFS